MAMIFPETYPASELQRTWSPTLNVMLPSHSAPSSWRGVRLYTIGHSTRTIDELITLLRTFGVSILADVRTIPKSRHNPQFEREALRTALRQHGIRYVHLPALGGLRHARKDSPNAGWRNASFRGYADYMQTDAFEEGLAELRELTTSGTVALMCAEAVPWRCHRSLIADVLTVRGAKVEHITSATRANLHTLTKFARVRGDHVTYPSYEPAGEQAPASGQPATKLATQGPFHLEATVRVLQRRPTNLVDVWQDDRYLRVLVTPRGHVLAEVANRGSVDAPDVRFRIIHGDDTRATRVAVGRTLRTILGLDVDPAPLQLRMNAERKLAPVALALKGMRPPRFSDLFETFANVIPFQQVSLDAGVAVVRRLVERFGEPMTHGKHVYHAFPTARRLAKARLDTIRSCGLSTKKAQALREVAAVLEAGELTERELQKLDREEAIERLTELSGIGPWSAALVLLRGLRRLDVFPANDVGVARGLSRLLRLQTPSSLERVVQRFGDLRGYLYFCSLGAALLEKGLIHSDEAQPAKDSKKRRVGTKNVVPVIAVETSRMRS